MCIICKTLKCKYVQSEITIMSLITLPEEILEILFSYVNAVDLCAVLTAFGLERSDFFWKKVCKREGYKKISKEDGPWKTVFYRNINWITNKFVKREYKYDHYERHLFVSSTSLSSRIKHVLHGQYLIVKNDEDNISVWNLDKYPIKMDILPANFSIVSSSKLLTCQFYGSQAKIKVYSVNKEAYSQLLSFDKKLSHNVSSYYALTDKHFAALDDTRTSIIVVNLDTNENSILPISIKEVKPISIVLLHYILYVMVLEESKYVLRRYDLEKGKWLEDLLLFQGVALIEIPKLKVSADLLVSWSNLLLSHSITPLKVWNLNGELIKTLSFEFINSFRIQLQTAPEEILWLVAEGKYIIFSTQATNIVIWNSEDPNSCKEITKSEHFYSGQTVISSSLIVLSYTCCFKVIDFRKAVYLYDVWFDHEQPNCRALGSPQPYCVNEYFYVQFKELENETTKTESTRTKSVTKASVSADAGLKPTNRFILTIYDYRLDADLFTE